MPKTTTLCDPKPERKGHSRIHAQHRSFIIISILIHLLTPSPHVSLPHGTNVEIEHGIVFGRMDGFCFVSIWIDIDFLIHVVLVFWVPNPTGFVRCFKDSIVMKCRVGT